MKVASVDLGTNTFRLMVVEYRGNCKDIWPLHEERRVVRIGEGVAREGKMALQAQERALGALREFRVKLEGLGVEKVVAVATSVFREAANASDFLQLAWETLGVPIRIISGDEEASLTLKGALIDLEASKGVLFDIGGGSTEFIRFRNRAPFRLISIPIGVVKLAETFLSHDPPLLEEMDALRDYVREGLSEVREHLGKEEWPLVGTAGTVTTLAAVDMGLSVYQHEMIHGYLLRKERVEEMLSTFLSMKKVERLQIPGLEEGREDLIVPGAIITLETMALWNQESLIVSDLGLREGALLDALGC